MALPIRPSLSESLDMSEASESDGEESKTSFGGTLFLKKVEIEIRAAFRTEQKAE